MSHTTTSKVDTQWARLRIDVDSVLRRGAWYRVLSITPDKVNLSINAEPVPIACDSLELRLGPPNRWTVLLHPTRVTRVPLNFHDGYVVCPSCRNRVPLPQRAAAALRCPDCHMISDVGWDEFYLNPSRLT